MTLDGAERIVAEFRKLSDKPVKAIIFTHSHGDHTGGAAAFLGKTRPQIWAHENWGNGALPLAAAGLTFQNVRGARQAGFKLPPEPRIINGVAPVRYPNRDGSVFASDQAARPTHFLEVIGKQSMLPALSSNLCRHPVRRTTNCLSGIRLVKYVRGRQFLPIVSKPVAIRGTPNRSVRLWAESLGKLADKDTVALVGGHTNQIQGANEVKQVLADYRDAVQFIHDKTVEGMNQGMTPDELVEYVQRPDNLASKA